MSAAIQIKDKQFKPYISEAEIQKAVSKIAQEINTRFSGKCPIFLSILNGSFMFSSDLFKQLTIDCEICFIKISSYDGTQSTGLVREIIGLDEQIDGRHVIVLEDIIDTGHTLVDLLPKLQNEKPASLHIASLLVKPLAMKHEIPISFFGIEIPNEFIVGYGLDYDGLGRNLKDIYQIVE